MLLVCCLVLFAAPLACVPVFADWSLLRLVLAHTFILCAAFPCLAPVTNTLQLLYCSQAKP